MSERKIFPVESVLALVSAKQGADIKDIAGYLVGRSLKCDKLAAIAGLFAGAWVSRLYPKFAEIVWDGNEAWEAFVGRASKQLGDNVSLPAMSGPLQSACDAALGVIIEQHDQIDAFKAEVASLSAKVEELKAVEGQYAAAKKRAEQLDDQLKAQKKDMAGLRRQVAEFSGKMAVDQEELLDAIKDAIKDNLKNVAVAAGAAAGVAAGAAAADGAAAPADEFGFGGDAAPADEFGFGPSASTDEFGF